MARAPAQSAPPVPQQAQRKSVSLWRHAWRRLLRNKLAVAGGSTIIFLAVLALGAVPALIPLEHELPSIAAVGLLAAITAGLVAYEAIRFGEARERLRRRLLHGET